MIDLRCKRCGNLLLKEDVIIGEVEVKCPRCNTYNYVRVLDSGVDTDYTEDIKSKSS